MAFTTQQREQLKLYMMDFSAARDAAITTIETAGTERQTEAIRLLARLNDLEDTRLSTAAKAAIISKSGKESLQSGRAVEVLRLEGFRICKALGAMMGLAPLDDYFQTRTLEPPGLFGSDADEARTFKTTGDADRVW